MLTKILNVYYNPRKYKNFEKIFNKMKNKIYIYVFSIDIYMSTLFLKKITVTTFGFILISYESTSDI